MRHELPDLLPQNLRHSFPYPATPVLGKRRARWSVTGDLVDQFVETMAKEVASRVVAALRQETPAGSAREWRLLTVAEVSKRLGRSERWVREKAKAGQLPWIRLDAGPLAFRIEDLEQFAAERRVPAENDFQPITACPNPTSHNGSRGERRVSNPGVKS